MKKTTNSSTPLHWYCAIFGHNYEMTRKVTSHVKEYTCKCCKHQLTTNSNGKLTELTPKYQEINAILEKIYTRRMVRLKNKSLSSSIY
ncbi:hypothetical protein [Psychroserpens sp.]|uniref:hypothetical protein n=1 Tax=Psychroserpens sp. TaxID=2020870 RepID=UPI001B03FD3A|nr:hypothetical protein [Psychroserpens sp.]MBO6605222.1 hypothetical protein [Psychroserpens sp.]MBO6630144.1 hypothetical protein [Psychroserpens sp.]MBO6653969.1 hypothetical protein [Psychroserpens sp.]MBO6682290.1 hypothetical protein [Psychroserpens sp.]MBO6748596.1 hypothetical protein [Psychroserpens sp.]